MNITKGKIEGSNSNYHAPILKSLLSSQNIYILTFDFNGKILEYSEGLKSLFVIENEILNGKNIDVLPLSKSEKPLTILNFKKGFPSSQKIYDVKFVTGHGRILTTDINVELSFSNEKLVGGLIHFELRKQSTQSPNTFNNLMSKSKFFLKEPIRISKLFAEKLGDKISDEEPVKKEYLNFITNNISSLDYLVNDLIILENLNTYHLDLQHNKLEEVVIIAAQESKGCNVDILLKELPKVVFCDRELIKLLINMSIRFSKYYSITSSSYLKIDCFTEGKSMVLKLKLGAVSFIDHPSFAPNRSLKRISNLKNPNTSGHELVIIDQIVNLHKGLLKIFINDINETEIEINLPTK